MYRNIMVPVDGSPFSREALLHGVRIAGQCRAKLHLVRVATMPVMLSPETPSLDSDTWGNHRARELAGMYQIANECRGSSTVTVTTSLLEGPICDALEGYIARHRIDLVVMRSHARHGLARVWFGSVADKLIRNTGVPVLVVRPPSLATGLKNGLRFKRILVPLDGSPLAEKSLHAAIELARLDRAVITLLRVVPSSRDLPTETRSPRGPASDRAVTQAESYLRSLHPALSEPALEFLPKVVIADDVATAILDTANSHEIDLIVIATHGRGAVARVAAGSVADRLLRESAISTVVIRPQLSVAYEQRIATRSVEPSFAI